MTLKLGIGKKVSELTGNGLEYLTDETGENIRAVFFDGNFVKASKHISEKEAEEKTLPVAA